MQRICLGGQAAATTSVTCAGYLGASAAVCYLSSNADTFTAHPLLWPFSLRTSVSGTRPATVGVSQGRLHSCCRRLLPQKLAQPCCCPMAHSPHRAQHITAQLVGQALEGPATRLHAVQLCTWTHEGVRATTSGSHTDRTMNAWAALPSAYRGEVCCNSENDRCAMLPEKTRGVRCCQGRICCSPPLGPVLQLARPTEH